MQQEHNSDTDLFNFVLVLLDSYIFEKISSVYLKTEIINRQH